jgi:hypothetical protein
MRISACHFIDVGVEKVPGINRYSDGLICSELRLRRDLHSNLRPCCFICVFASLGFHIPQVYVVFYKIYEGN